MKKLKDAHFGRIACPQKLHAQLMNMHLGQQFQAHAFAMHEIPCQQNT